MKRTTIVYRALIVFAFAALLLAVIGGRFLYVQIAQGTEEHDYLQYAERQWTSEQPLHGERGTIYASNESAIAEEVSSYTIQLILRNDFGYAGVEDLLKPHGSRLTLIWRKVSCYQRIENGMEEDQFQIELGPGASYLTFEQRQAIDDLELSGIEFRTEPRRYYPKQDFASHVVGYFNRNENSPAMGLESYLNDHLEGTGGSYSYMRARNGVPLPGEIRDIEEAYNGDDIHLTLHSNIQLAVEQALTNADEQYSPERMIAVVANPKSGEILAMSNRPSFNPNHYESISNHMNFAVSDHFEPGSTMKIFTMQQPKKGCMSRDDYFESGTYNTGYADTPLIRDHNQGRGWGSIPYREAMPRSANTAFASIVNDQLGAERFYEYMNAFGFGSPTGIELPMEAPGSCQKMIWVAIYSGFGQASAVTPIQQIQAATAIANDGQMVKPYLIDSIVNPNTGDVTYEHEREVIGEPISKETANEVMEQLHDVVYSDVGTGKPFQVDGIEVAGKTGTAQIPSEGGYLQGHNQNVFSFLGMAPFDDPEVIVYVAVDRPDMQNGQSGNQAVAEIFNSVLKQSIQYLNVTPEESDNQAYQPEGAELMNVSGERRSDAVDALQQENLEPVLLGQGNRVEAQLPAPHAKVLAGEKVFLYLGGEMEMPDLSGWSVRDVMKFSQAAGVTVEQSGNGYVINQEIAPGEPISGNETIEVNFDSERNSDEDEEDSEEGTEEESLETNDEEVEDE
ncbi:LOW QUALITY PROTEIN: penicillin-binding protein [Geomicrobium sp. JCM 19037]|nr:LOW QUALITY PROTEIN: penicillin-binding protein [Geomicrobium sp. JCM 19037]